MTNFSSAVNDIRNGLIQAYCNCSELEQEIVQLFSLIYESASRSMFVKCCIALRLQNEAGKRVDANTVKAKIDHLLDLDLLIQGEKSNEVRCNPLLPEVATRDVVKSEEKFMNYIEAIDKYFPIPLRWKNGPRKFSGEQQLIREVRIGFYAQDMEHIDRQFIDYYKYSYSQEEVLSFSDIFKLVCTNPFDAEWFRSLDPEIFESGLTNLLIDAYINCEPAAELLKLAEEDYIDPTGFRSEMMQLAMVEQYLMRGDISAAQTSLLRDEFTQAPEWAGICRGWLLFTLGDFAGSITEYSQALKAVQKRTSQRNIYFTNMGGIFFIFALLKEGSPKSLKDAEKYTSFVAGLPEQTLHDTHARLRSLVKLQRGEVDQREVILDGGIYPYDMTYAIETLTHALCLYWADAEVAKKTLPGILSPFCEAAEAAEYYWLAWEIAELLARVQSKTYTSRAIKLSQCLKLPLQAATSTTPSKSAGTKLLQGSTEAEAECQNSQPASDPVTLMPLVELLKPKQAWEFRLDALVNLGAPVVKATSTELQQMRLAWLIKFSETRANCSIQPREQKITKSGDWSKGRPIALKRLKQPDDFGYLIPQDHQVCTQIEREYAYYGDSSYVFNECAIASLGGHPHVFWEDSPSTRVEIVSGEPQLLIKKNQKQQQLTLKFAKKLPSQSNIMVIKETPTRLKVVEIRSEHRQIAEILGQGNQLKVPLSSEQQVLAAINAVSRLVTVQSDIGGEMANAEEVPADNTPHLHLLPAGEGLKVAVRTRPFAAVGPYYAPGTGGSTVIAEIDGKRLQTTRDLKQEKQQANVAISACPTLSIYEEEAGEWQIDNPEHCLELLTELHELDDEAVKVEWPEGETMRITHRADLSNFQLSIRQQKDWFAAEGELKLNEDLVLSMGQLMELLQKTPGRFIQLEDGQFLALTQTFRKRLEDLQAFSEKQGDGVRFHPLTAVALEEFVDQVGKVKTDKHWKEHAKRLKEMREFQPQLPSTFQAELRDYQKDGFDWLARLAHWGVGACLADDMGLGKTIQALAVILTRAPQGPTLVIAPTSVGLNWASEAQRFAPTLNIVQFGSGDRQETLDQLQPLDLFICTYGLLQQEDVAAMLAQVEWQTIVLDEAQAIKNSATKRSQAAMKLQGGFKIITTGTPIENHLGELWNLFRFINPGLLGSQEKFNQNFAYPIERYQDPIAKNQLKRLIQPFMLRRTKNQVLQELPSRTEILLQVELSTEEMALYEATRRQAIEKLSNSDATAGAKHLQVLAEITRLRRLCCNPELVMPDAGVSSAKLQLFGEVLEELLSNHHKSLVFSQFVDHLQIIKNHLEQKQISYQYLDGSTPAKERKKRVDAFQSGEGDVFLISLKAGGTGLNLTAADYVIHMDPWWNPAVEDQASDRAHRIGQQRPVTIYRLVSKNTIEEKIVDLHQQKRDLADSLLEVADVSGKISTDELLRLISAG
ncbi:MAG: DEAD/DEAH box helicase [Microcoleaceae cyanobacterium]